MRDGTVTEKIPLDCDSSSVKCKKYGMHENYSYYLNCQSRERNKGLFTANQKLKGDSAIYTRQDRQGTRYGFECPEERDYFPYWSQSPWNLVAVLTDYRKCAEIKAQIRAYDGYCTAEKSTLEKLKEYSHKLPLTKRACEIGFANLPRLRWVEESKSTDFFCGKPMTSRDNHHGNNGDAGHSQFTWKIPKSVPTETPCVLRIRYNISSADYPTNSRASDNGKGLLVSGARSLTFGEAEKRGFELKNDPRVSLFEFAPGVKLELNIQTGKFNFQFF